ncbi:MAG: two-component system sensor protein [Glaciihabitans sp.]|jgi:two-component system OmpR family sensor kinase|nr:two-component system sensor protein [Glaciihabitans sp.]
MKWLRSQAIRSRITIWSVVIAIVLIAIAGLGFRISVDSIVSGSTRDLLASDGAPYEASIVRGDTKTFARPAEDQLIALIDPTGAVRISDLPSSLADKIESLADFGHGVHIVTTRSKSQYDVQNETVHTKAGDWHVIEARNRAEGDVVLSGLTTVTIVGGVALVVAFGIASWIVTGLALRPVTRLRRQASLLAQNARAGILPIGPVHDEISALAITLNEFITSERASADRERQMVADASHELRTPIAVLTTQLQLAHLSTGDAEALEGEIAAAEQTLTRLANLTTNLLTLSRIEAEEEVPVTSADALLAEFFSSMDRAIVLGSAHSVAVDFTTDGVDAKTAVTIPPVDFAGLVDNLVSNAIAASPRGSGVDVRLARIGKQLVLTVADRGHGITDDFLPVAFDRFSRPEESRQHTIGGNGLGLAIVKAIVVRSGGGVRLEQRKEGGVRAVVTFPTVS